MRGRRRCKRVDVSCCGARASPLMGRYAGRQVCRYRWRYNHWWYRRYTCGQAHPLCRTRRA